MKKVIIVLFLCFAVCSSAYGQLDLPWKKFPGYSKDMTERQLYHLVKRHLPKPLPAPKNVQDAVRILEFGATNKVKRLLREKETEKRIYLSDFHYLGRNIEYFSWTDNNCKNSRLGRYFAKNGVYSSLTRDKILLSAYRNHYYNNEFNEADTLIKYAAIESNYRRMKIDTLQKADRINGVYIPKNPRKCIKVLDTLLSDSIKIDIMKMSMGDFAACTHLGLGMWLRNNWGLWRGSRLFNYFAKRNAYVEPDDISWDILECYYCYLKENRSDYRERLRKMGKTKKWNKTPYMYMDYMLKREQ